VQPENVAEAEEVTVSVKKAKLPLLPSSQRLVPEGQQGGPQLGAHVMLPEIVQVLEPLPQATVSVKLVAEELQSVSITGKVLSTNSQAHSHVLPASSSTKSARKPRSSALGSRLIGFPVGLS
jgi:hypothetical protein